MSLDIGARQTHTASVRLSILAAFVALIMAASAGAATTSTYAATKRCLAASGGTFEAAKPELFKFPEEKQTLYWVAGRDAKGKPNDVSIYFTDNVTAALRLEQKILKLTRSIGATAAYVKARMGRMANAVWLADLAKAPPASRPRTLLARCLAT
jgi:uncharacterized protein YbjT (DUF2867 family)